MLLLPLFRLKDTLSLLMSPRERQAIPNVMRWFTTVISQPQFVAVVGFVKLVGAREGGMIDLRPQPQDVAVLADAAVGSQCWLQKEGVTT